MGLGDGPRWWLEYEWVDLSTPAAAPRGRGPSADGPDDARRGGPSAGEDAGSRTRRSALVPASRPAAEPEEPVADAALGAEDLAAALREQIQEAELFTGHGPHLLLVDLDNLRAGPARWAARMAVVLDLARRADYVALAGQVGPVERAVPHLAEFASRAEAVPDGSDVADHALLDSALIVGRAPSGPGQVVVASNDGIFAELVEEGWEVVVLSPGRDAMSAVLREAATRTVDLVDAERTATRRFRSRALRAGAAASSSARAARAEEDEEAGVSPRAGGRGTSTRRRRAPQR